MLCVQVKRLRYQCMPLLAGTLLSVGSLADELPGQSELSQKKLPNYTREIDSRSYESIKYAKGLKVKGWRFSEGVYFGGVKVDGQYGPGLVFDNGGYVWGFNHERIQFRLRF